MGLKMKIREKKQKNTLTFAVRSGIIVLLLLVGGSAAWAEEEEITAVMANLVLQIGIILFVVRLGGMAVKKLGIPSVLGELLSGVIIGPYALGGIALPGFPNGIFPLNSASLAVSPELYSFATVASIILLFASGLETDFALFLKYSVAGGIVGIGGVVVSFFAGAGVGAVLLHRALMDPVCLFLGIMSTATSVGITARILSEQKKMDSPEGVTTLAAAVFDDVLGIILLAVVLGVVSALSGSSGGITAGQIGVIAGRAFGIWLGFTALGLVFSKQIASFLKFFRGSFDFSICALGIGLLLAGIFEKQGLAMIIGAYVTGLSLSGTDIAAVIEERIHGLYEFFVPMFFAVMGMMVNVGELMSGRVLFIGFVYTVAAILAKIIGCGLPTLALGFNTKGAFRIGTGMIPRGEVALIIAGIGITAGILDEQLFGVVIMMTLVTTLVAPPLLNMALRLPGRGTKKETRSGIAASMTWDFGTDEIADLVVDILLKDLKAEGFYVQMMNVDEGLSQARKGEMSLSIIEQEHIVTIETSQDHSGFVKAALYEVVLRLSDSMQDLKKSCDTESLKKEFAEAGVQFDPEMIKLITPNVVCAELKADDKPGVLREMVALLANSGKVHDWEQVYHDISEREKSMSTGLQYGIAMPHAKTEGVDSICVAIGIKKNGIDFGSIDGKPSTIFVMLASPKKSESPHIQFLASVSTVLRDESVRKDLLNAQASAEVAAIIRAVADKRK